MDLKTLIDSAPIHEEQRPPDPVEPLQLNSNSTLLSFAIHPIN